MRKEEGLQAELKEERQKVLKVFREYKSCPQLNGNNGVRKLLP